MSLLRQPQQSLTGKDFGLPIKYNRPVVHIAIPIKIKMEKLHFTDQRWIIITPLKMISSSMKDAILARGRQDAQCAPGKCQEDGCRASPQEGQGDEGGGAGLP